MIRRQSKFAASWLCAVGIGLSALSVETPASACGGLFCSTSAPVNQAAERIVFADNGDGTITAVIEIMYEGPSDEFSWALPVAGIPTVGLSSVNALDRLQNATAPLYTLNTMRDDSCPVFRGALADAGALIADGGALAPTDAVTVVAAGTVGPFDYEVIEVSDDADNPGAAAIEWMQTNGYDVSALGEDLLNVYFAEGMNLIAFRLTKDATSGSIRPVSITYTADASVIPIRPTAVAANENMGVLVWVLGAGRAVPVNYRTLELNETLINWFDPSSNYDSVVSAAADEAGGHGFVTEMATNEWDQRVFSERSVWQGVQQFTSPEQRLELLLVSAEGLGHLDGFTDAVRRAVPLRDGVTPEEYTSCPSCYFSPYNAGNAPVGTAADGGTVQVAPVEGGVVGGRRFPTAEEDPIAGIDVTAYLAALDELVIAPMVAMDDLLTRGDSLTRLYTTLSPDEMTEDPVFDFNVDLDEVSRIHTRDRTLWCDDDGQTQWSIDFDGAIVEGTGTEWPLSVGDGPAAKRIVQLGLAGEGDVVDDRTDEILRMLAPPMPQRPTDDPEPAPVTDDDDFDPGDPQMDDGTSPTSPTSGSDDGPGSQGDDSSDDPAGSPDGMGDAGTSVSQSDDSDDGCGCAVIGATQPRSSFWMLVAIAGLGLLRRRHPERR